jgi:hypothetical protein
MAAMSTSDPPLPPPPFTPPAIVPRIPEDQPLVLRPDRGRIIRVFGLIYIVVPLAFMVVAGAALAVAFGEAVILAIFAGMGALFFGVFGALQLALMLGLLSSGGPYLAAGPDGVWIRARKWPAKSVFLPWPLVGDVYVRRWLWDRVVCVRPIDRRTIEGIGLMGGIDMGVQSALFGARFTASAFYCGHDAHQVVAELGRFRQGSPG